MDLVFEWALRELLEDEISAEVHDPFPSQQRLPTIRRESPC